MIRVFIACSLDGFIAGPRNDLSWLPSLPGVDVGFESFLAEVGTVLMGRNTYDVVETFQGEWPYGTRPVLVATHRQLPQAKVSTVHVVQGNIEMLLGEALHAAQGRAVYIDGGTLIRQALDANRIDRLTITFVPCILGQGTPLFTGTRNQHHLTLLDQRTVKGLVQVTYAPINR